MGWGELCGACVCGKCVNDSMESGGMGAFCWYGGEMLLGGKVLRVCVGGEGVVFTFHFATLRCM